MKVVLNIEQLILDGLPISQEQGRLVQASLERELARQLSDGNVNLGQLSGTAVPSIHVDAIRIGPKSGPAQIGIQIARVVYGGIGSTQ